MSGFVSAPPRRFPANTLPWIVAASALVVFAVTLNPWVSLTNVEQVARVSGWLWQPDLQHPLYFLVTLPLRLLPKAWVPALLNLLNAVCAAAVLGLLARSVALLPHDRTHAQRIRLGYEGDIQATRLAWLPPVLAAVVCGLQLTFWENATSGTREMLDLLVFAYAIHCLLVFRKSGRQMWLSQAAFVWGLGMSGNFAMIGFFPAYIVALIWIKGIEFFNVRFLVRMALWGLAGMSLYLLLPIIQMQDSALPLGFWQGLKTNLASQKSVLLGFPNYKTLLLLGLTSWIPLLLISIRWRENFGDINPIGAKVANWVFHGVHVLFFVSCLWIALDPPVSPRNAGYGLPFLTFYYLGAIVIGYLAGYFLVVFGRAPMAGPFARKRRTGVMRFTRTAIAVITVAMAVGLMLRNLPQIRITNSNMTHDYASLIAEALPEGNTVVLSDDSLQQLFVKAALEQRGNRPDVFLLDSKSLKWPQYQQIMAKRYPDRWPDDVPTNRVTSLPDFQILRVIAQLSKSNHLCYAHPSFGYYFEFLYARPMGILERLFPYERGELLAPPLTEEQIEYNVDFWQNSARPLLAKLRQAQSLQEKPAAATKHKGLLDKLHLVRERNRTATLLGTYLSRSLNMFGVKLQRAGHVEQAAEYFEMARQFNPDNVVARINQEFNEDLQAGRPSSVKVSESLQDEFGKYRGWNSVIEANGWFDEPKFTEAWAGLFVRGRLFREALREFNRARELKPHDLAAQLWYARLCGTMGQPDKALQTVADVRNHAADFPALKTNQVQLMFVEATAYAVKKDYDRVVETVSHALATEPASTNLMGAALRLYMNNRMFTNALDLINLELSTDATNVNLLVNKGFTLIQLERFEDAINVLTKALDIEKDNRPARLNRAIAYLRLGQLDESQQDYETLLLQMPKAHPIYFGLAEIASRRHDTNLAIYNYRLYLSNAPPNIRERRIVQEKLASLTGGDD